MVFILMALTVWSGSEPNIPHPLVDDILRRDQRTLHVRIHDDGYRTRSKALTFQIHSPRDTRPAFTN